ncbi:unnamed protein product, partial [Pylaiella littoralis]
SRAESASSVGLPLYGRYVETPEEECNQQESEGGRVRKEERPHIGREVQGYPRQGPRHGEEEGDNRARNGQEDAKRAAGLQGDELLDVPPGDVEEVPMPRAQAAAALAKVRAALGEARQALSSVGLSTGGDERFVAESLVQGLAEDGRLAVAEVALAEASEALSAAPGGSSSEADRAVLGRVLDSTSKQVRAVRRKRALESQDLQLLEDVLLVWAQGRSTGVNPCLLTTKMLAYYAKARALDEKPSVD